MRDDESYEYSLPLDRTHICQKASNILVCGLIPSTILWVSTISLFIARWDLAFSVVLFAFLGGLVGWRARRILQEP